MSDYRFIDDDSPADEDDLAEYPDAVYDAEDPEWQELLERDGYEYTDDVADFDPFGDAEHEGSPDEWGWDDWPDEWDGDYYEVEIGIDYGEDS